MRLHAGRSAHIRSSPLLAINLLTWVAPAHIIAAGVEVVVLTGFLMWIEEEESINDVDRRRGEYY